MRSIHRFVIAAAAALALLTACELGQIQASYPQVFSAERMVRQRFEDQQYLENKIKTEPSFEFQGLIDTRQRRQLAIEAQVEEGAGVEVPDADSVGTELRPSATSAELPDPGSAVVTRAKAHPVDVLKSLVGYRDAARLMMRERMLDDVHDANGNVLYEMNFGLTMIPSRSQEEYGVAVFRALNATMTDLTDAELEEIFNAVCDAVDIEVRDYAGQLSQKYRRRLVSAQVVDAAIETLDREKGDLRYALDNPSSFLDLPSVAEQLPEDEQARAESFADAMRLGMERRDSAKRGLRASWNDGPGTTVAADEGGPTAGHSPMPTWDGIALATLMRLPPWFHLCDCGETVRVDRERSFRDFLARIREEIDGCSCRGETRRCSGGSKCKSKAPYVLLDAPREYSQNISEVSGLSDVLQSSLKAGFSKGTVAVRGAIDMLRETQTLLHAIKRQPLLLVFGRGRSTFGWVLGPSFKIKNFKPEFEQSPVHHSAAVQVVVPRFAKSVKIDSAYGWIQSWKLYDRNRDRVRGEIDELFGKSELWPRGKEEVELPVEIEVARFAIEGPSHVPRISTVAGELVVGRPEQSILIRGSNLWRNPTVILAGQKASHVEVQPDMGGILATFASLRPVAPGSRGLPVRVATSHGTAVSPILVPVRTTDVIQTFASLAQGQVLTESGNLVFDYRADSMPSGYHRTILTIRPVGTGPWQMIDRLPRIDPKAKKLSFALEQGEIKASARYEIGLMMQKDPFSDARRVPSKTAGSVLGTATLFKNNVDASAKLTPNEIVVGPLNKVSKPLVLSVSKLVALAHPGLAGAKVEVEFVVGTAKAVVTKTWSAGARKLVLSIADLGTKLASFKGESVKLRVLYPASAPKPKQLAVSTTLSVK